VLAEPRGPYDARTWFIRPKGGKSTEIVPTQIDEGRGLFSGFRDLTG